MLARLFLLLMVVAFASVGPASARCHDPVQRIDHVMSMPVDRSDHPTDKITSAHECIGCIPHGNWLSPPGFAPALTAVAKPVADPATLDLISASSPDLPPPRWG